jgi:RHS repeat-associated protein
LREEAPGEGLPTDRRYTGQRWDGGLGLYDYRARYYDPALGRFIQPDPLVPDPANPQSLNRYAYVLNNPMRYTDPSGYLSEDQIERWVDVDIDSLDQETLDLLLVLHFGDELYMLLNGECSAWGTAGLGDKGLQFDNGSETFTVNSMLDMRTQGGHFLLTRPTGMGEWRYAYVPWSPDSVYRPTDVDYHETTEFEGFLRTRLTQELKNEVIAGGIGTVIGAVTPVGPIGGLVIGLTVSEALRVASPDGPLPGNQTGDETLEYWYDDGLYETTVIRDNRVIQTRWSTWWNIPVP